MCFNIYRDDGLPVPDLTITFSDSDRTFTFRKPRIEDEDMFPGREMAQPYGPRSDISGDFSDTE